MKVFVYNYQEQEAVYFNTCNKALGIDISTCPQQPSIENANLSQGYECISVLSTPISRALILKFHEIGVRFISTRTIGYDHIDLAAAKEVGIHIGNATYAPESVADYTIMLILMSLRKMKMIMKNCEVQDYGVQKLEGRNLKNKILGVIGTGNIGQTLIRHIAGFECKILAYNPHPKEEMKPFVEYVGLDTLLQQSDIITLHIPYNEDTYHIFNSKTFAKMKDGVVIVNSSRGPLIDNKALISAIESGKVGAAALDVIEGETNIYYRNQKGNILKHHDLAILNAFPNVILSPHMAFLTDDSHHDMVVNSMKSCYAFMHGKDNPWEITCEYHGK